MGLTDEEKRALFGRGPSDPLAARVPLQRVPELDDARDELLQTAETAIGMSTPGAAGFAEARDLLAAAEGIPPAQPVAPTLWQSVQIAAQPRTTAQRVRTPAEEVEAGRTALGHHAVTAAALPTGPLAKPIANLAVPSIRGQGIGEALGLTGAPEDALGMPAENETLYLLRLFGSVAPAVVTETAERVKIPNLARAPQIAERIGQGDLLGAYSELVSSTWGDDAATLGGLVLGIEPGSLQRHRREGPFADWLQGVAERVGDGRGLEGDLAASFKTRFGPDAENYGWWLGFGLDVLTDWEGALASGPKVVGALNRRASMVRDAVKGLDLPDLPNRWVLAAKNNEIEIGEWLGSKIAEGLEDGRLTVDQLPPALRARAQEVALNEHGLSLEELARAEGVGAPTRAAVVDPEFVAGREAVGAAARGVPGVDPGAFAERAKVVRGVEEGIDQAPLPEFGREVGNAEEFWQEVARLYTAGAPPSGYKITPGTGFRRMLGNQDMTVDRPRYALRNFAGDVIEEGEFETVVDKMLKRQLDGDEVWWAATKRPVARWAKKDGEKLSADYFFASPVEERLVSVIRSNDPRAFPKRLRQIEEAKAAAGVTPQSVGRALADTLTEAPLGGRAPRSRTGAVAVTAARLYGRDRAGASLLAALPNGALVAKGDRDRILARVNERLAAAGVPRDVAERLHHGAPLTDAMEQGLAGLAAELGVARTAGSFSIDQWNELRKAAIARAAGALGDLRYRIRGAESTWRSLLGVVADAHLDRRKRGWFEQVAVQLPLVQRFSRAFLEDTLARVPPAVRAELTALRTALERNSDDLLLRARKVFADARVRAGRFATLDPASALHELLGEYTPVRLADLDLALELRRAVPDAATRSAVRDRIAAAHRGARPRWFDTDDELLIADGVHRWAAEQVELAADQGREWVSAHLLAAGKDVGFGTALRGTVEQLPLEIAERIYRELMAGELTGDALRAALARITSSEVVTKLDPERAIATFLLSQRARVKIRETMDRLVQSGFVVRPTDIRAEIDRQVGARPSALVALAEGSGRHWNEAAARWEYEYPEAAITWANARLRDWGIDPESGAVLQRAKIGGKDVVLPKYLVDEIGRLAAAGLVDSRTITNVKAFDALTRAFKQWTTHGVILPNPAYFTGQILGMAPMLVTTQGWTGATRAGLTFLRNPVMIGELMRRLSGAGAPTFLGRLAESRYLRTADGGLLSIDALEAAAKKNGLADTTTSFETGEQLTHLLSRQGMRWYARMPIMAAESWQRTIQGFAGSIDQSMRMAVFLERAAAGTPLDEAAQVARRALLDFRDLTRFEAEYMRMAFTFYAFLRKNADAHLRALFEHPARVLSQIRLAHGSLTEGGLTELEVGALREEDLARLTVYDDEQVVDDKGRVHPLYRLNRLQSTPIGVPEFLLDLRALVLGPLGFAGLGPSPEQDRNRLLGQLHPLAQTFAVLALGQKLGAYGGGDLAASKSNRMPPALMDSFLGSYMTEVFGVGPQAIGPDEDPFVSDDDASAELGSGERAVWAAGADRTLSPGEAEAKRRLWQTVVTWVGRPLSTVTQLRQGANVLPDDLFQWLTIPPDPYLTEQEEAISLLTGLTFRPVTDDRETMRRHLRAREGRLRDKTEELQRTLPTDRR